MHTCAQKHLDDIPELKAEKQATNRRTLVAMSKALAAGGRLLWIAPSGGRDRSIDPATGEPPASPLACLPAVLCVHVCPGRQRRLGPAA
jgi:hypothetical protein